MKKVLSVLLTICLFATMVIPAFADYGVASDVAKVEFDKSEYKLEDLYAVRTDAAGDVILDAWGNPAIESIDLTSLMTAYDAHGNRTNFDEATGDTSLQIEEWYSSYENVLSVVGDRIVINRSDVGTADLRVTLTAKTTTEKKASTTIIVPKEAVAGKVNDAIGFSTLNTTLETDQTPWKVYTGIVPVLKNYVFTATQKANFAYAVKLPGTTTWMEVPVNTVDNDGISINGVTFVAGLDENGFMRLYYYYSQSTVDSDAEYAALVNNNVITQAAADKYDDVLGAGESIRVRVLGTQGFPSTQKDKEFAINIINPVEPTVDELKLPVSINMNVGEVLDLTTLNSTLKDIEADWYVAPYGSYQTTKEAGQIAKVLVNYYERHELKALAEGVVNVVLNRAGYADRWIKVNVGDGVANTPKMTASATVKVGEQVKLSIKELPAGATVKWAISNDNVNLGQWTGDYTNVYGKKAGTAVVTARIYNAETDGDLLYTLETTVTVEAADASTSTPAPSNPSTTAPTTNPQTGDSIFAGLFC